uniref:Uncharacterized protein n=1 Tax=Nelumbo nucifera TaxID=4432 RepID=A0A822YXC9_NELNU|nr:TPA_asm: hypothetical protein HUJ06_012739 [Nelumbo nucifera]
MKKGDNGVLRWVPAKTRSLPHQSDVIQELSDLNDEWSRNEEEDELVFLDSSSSIGSVDLVGNIDMRA